MQNSKNNTVINFEGSSYVYELNFSRSTNGVSFTSEDCFEFPHNLLNVYFFDSVLMLVVSYTA